MYLYFATCLSRTTGNVIPVPAGIQFLEPLDSRGNLPSTLIGGGNDQQVQSVLDALQSA
jgi:thiamine monophosphate synthase